MIPSKMQLSCTVELVHRSVVVGFLENEIVVDVFLQDYDGVVVLHYVGILI